MYPYFIFAHWHFGAKYRQTPIGFPWIFSRHAEDSTSANNSSDARVRAAVVPRRGTSGSRSSRIPIPRFAPLPLAACHELARSSLCKTSSLQGSQKLGARGSPVVFVGSSTWSRDLPRAAMKGRFPMQEPRRLPNHAADE